MGQQGRTPTNTCFKTCCGKTNTPVRIIRAGATAAPGHFIQFVLAAGKRGRRSGRSLWRARKTPVQRTGSLRKEPPGGEMWPRNLRAFLDGPPAPPIPPQGPSSPKNRLRGTWASIPHVRQPASADLIYQSTYYRVKAGPSPCLTPPKKQTSPGSR